LPLHLRLPVPLTLYVHPQQLQSLQLLLHLRLSVR